MSPKEITEELIEKKSKKDKKKQKIIIVSTIAILIFLVVCGLFAFFLIQRQKDAEYQKQIDLGYQYLEEEEFEKAEIAFNEAITIDDKKPEGFEGLGETKEILGDVVEAEKNYKIVYEITEDVSFLYRSEEVIIGNTNGNLSNGGSIVNQVNTTYIIENNVTESYIWKEKNGKQELETKLVLDNDPATNLAIRGRSLYYLQDGSVHKYDLTNKKNTGFTLANIIEYQIYEDKIYYMTYDEQNDKSEIITTDLEGKGSKSLIKFDHYGYKFIIANNSLYVVQTQYNSYEDTILYKINISKPELEEIYENRSAVITGLTLRKEYLYFKLTKNNEYSPSLYALNLKSDEVEEIIDADDVSAINIDDNNLFFISDNELYKADLNGDNPELIIQLKGQTPTQQYPYSLMTINTTPDNVYLVNSLSDNIYDSVGLKNQIYVASNENLKDLEQIKLSDNQQELDDGEPETEQLTRPRFSSEIPEEYRYLINEYYNAFVQYNSELEEAESLFELYNEAENYNKPGYTFIDIDNNGILDCLIGSGKDIYRVYTIDDGELYNWLASESLEIPYYLTYNNYFKAIIPESDVLKVFELKVENGIIMNTIEEVWTQDFEGVNALNNKYPSLDIDYTYIN